MIKLEEIQKKLSESIKKSGITQKELASRLGIKQPNIAQYIKGDSMPALDTFANLCKILDVDSNEILCIDD